MNLVAKEFVAARTDLKGVLVLSEFTGAARELTEALIVNPYDLEEQQRRAGGRADHAARRAARPHALDALAPGSIQRLPLGGKNAGGRRPVAQSGTRRGTSGRSLERGPCGLTMQYLLSRPCRAILTRLCPGADSLRLRFRWDAVADCRSSGACRHARPDPVPCSAAWRRRARAWLSRGAPGRTFSPSSRASTSPARSAITAPKLVRVSSALRSRVAQWQESLELALGSLPGVWVEDKGLSLAVHYRQAPERRRMRAAEFSPQRGSWKAFASSAARRWSTSLLESTPHKGQALAAERDRLGCDWVLYVGDDENDEDAFALDGNIVGVRIGRKKDSHARYYLRDQAEIDKPPGDSDCDVRSETDPGGAFN